jgi:hypothetical protein
MVDSGCPYKKEPPNRLDGLLIELRENPAVEDFRVLNHGDAFLIGI